MKPGRELPRLEAALARLLLRGHGAEHVHGDLIERWVEELERGGSPGRARRRLRRDLLATALRWWTPSAVRGRRARGGGPGPRHGVGGWIQDLGVALRSLVRRRSFAAAVTVTLGLGIGATTTIFTVVDTVVLRELPFDEAERMVAVGTTFPTREWADEDAGLQHLAGMSVANVLDIDARARSFDLLAWVEATSVLLPDRGEGPELASAASVSPDFFELMAVTPALGRTFVPGEYAVGGPTPFMISHGAWERRFGGDPDIVGRSLDRVGTDAVFVGVLPRDFEPPEAVFGEIPDFWMPLQSDHDRYLSRGRRSVTVIGRLLPDVTVEDARAEGTRIAAELAEEFPDGNVYPDGSWFGIGVNGLRDHTVGTAARTLRIFLAASGLLLLLAAMNAATLILARSLDRMRELEVRMALGAGRARVVRLLVAESLLLAGAGGALGVAVAWGGVALFLRHAPASMPRTGDIGIDVRILAVTAGVSVLAGLVAGLLPALRLVRGASAAGPGAIATGSARGATAGTSRLRSGLVVGQVAVAMLLLSGAGLLFNSFMRIVSIEPGFDPEGLVSLNVPVKRPGAPEGEEMWQAWDLVLAEMERVPGVTAVAGTSNPPFQSPFWAPRILLPEDSPETWREGIAGYSITPGYLSTMGTRLLSGRDFDTGDRADTEAVVLVNEAFVATVLEGREPLGMILRNREGDDQTAMRVVGVVEDVIQGRAEEGRRPAVYVPYTQVGWPFVQVVARSTLPGEEVIPALRQAVRRFSSVVPPRDVRTMDDRMASTRTTPRFQTMLIGAFALSALLLAASGLYGSLSHAVRRRERELGVRMALGAARAGVLGLVVRGGLQVALTGIVLGVLATLASTRVLAGFLYGVEPNDPLTLAGVGFGLAVVSLLASLLPGRRATAVDPVEVLKAE